MKKKNLQIFFNHSISLKDIEKDKNPKDSYYIIRKSILMEIYIEIKRLQELEKVYKFIINKFAIEPKDYKKIIRRRQK